MERRHCLPLLLLLLPAAVQAKWEGGTAKVVVGQGADDDDDDLLKPTFLSDRAARDEHKYLRRKPKCLADAAKQPPMAKRLHQIWWQGASQVPSHFETLRSTWALHHPDWELKVWDQSSITALVEEQYDWFAPVFHALPSRIQQVDAARYIILHSEGGLYADLDIECFKPLDGRLNALGSALAFFEEPSTHWTAHGTVVSNGMIGAAAGHPMLLRLIRGVTTKSSVFAATGSHMLQRALQECHDAPGLACGCYVTYSSREFFPLHDSMRAPEEFNSLDHHEKHVKAFVQDLSQRKWPPAEAYTAQYWTVSWIDADIGSLFLEGLRAARGGDHKGALTKLSTVMCSKWGNMFKYRRPGGAYIEGAKQAYKKAIDLDGTYPWSYYELALIELEKSRPVAAAKLLKTAVELRPDDLLFVNNMGVALSNQQNKAAEAEVHFRKVLELEKSSFATIKRLAPRAGALLNLGIVLQQQERVEEANQCFSDVMHEASSYDYTLAAARRLNSADSSQVPPTEELDFLLGKALLKEGRTREAAVRFAAAYMADENQTKPEFRSASKSKTGEIDHADDANDPSKEGKKVDKTLTPEGRADLHARVKEQMDLLAEVWDSDENVNKEKEEERKRRETKEKKKRDVEHMKKAGLSPDVDIHKLDGGDGKTEVKMVEVQPDGTTKTTSKRMAPSELKKFSEEAMKATRKADAAARQAM